MSVFICLIVLELFICRFRLRLHMMLHLLDKVLLINDDIVLLFVEH